MHWIILGTIVSYLIGSIPTAYIIGRLLKGIDIREFGSGNIGATNALRVLGKPAGITVLTLDILKGFLAVVLLGNFISLRTALIPNETLRMILGIGCISGHNWTVFLKFRGGKGIATTLGVLLGLAVRFEVLKIVLLLVILTWFGVFIIFRIVSVASVIASIMLPIYMILFKGSKALIFTSILLSIFSILRHKNNIQRVLEGKEKRLFK